MACQYFVKGNWVSEETFKQILINGLLDNLVVTETIELDNFTPDTSKLVKVEKKEVRHEGSVPAQKIKDILEQEIRTRQGYPLNMIEALELEEDGSDFKIPLWASPFATKFESLLTSIVSNRVIKQKFHGNSYVLASEEGFRIAEGEEGLKAFKNSGIVFSENFDPEKGLQPMRIDPETGKILPAQVILPFKFRDEFGNILDINKFTKKLENGRTVLDFELIPQKVLKLFGFRIPTQEQNSMAAIEIVGFLPELSGDMIIAPRDFTKQMGSDFDVDKMYSYMYHTYYKDGRLHTDFASDPAQIEQEKIETIKEIQLLKKELRISQDEEGILDRFLLKEDFEEGNGLDKILEALGKRESKEVQKQLKDAINKLSVLKRSYVAAKQNALLDIHHKVMTSSNPAVVRSIISLDSSGEFKQLSTDIYSIRKERGFIPPIKTILSDSYQRTKYVNATAGKAGVGKFSLDSTFNAIAQGKNLVVSSLREEPIKFGEITSTGDISNKYTLASQKIIDDAGGISRLSAEQRAKLKTKSVVIRSLQSSAVDNEKEQILDKLNINSTTFPVITAMTLLGFEETDVAGVLTSEIIWEFVSKLQAASSSLGKFNPNAEQEIVDSLIAKYNPKGLTIEESNLSGEKLIEDLKTQKLVPNETNDYNLRQLEILQKFLQLKQVGKEIGDLQILINPESKGLAPSLLEIHNKVIKLRALEGSPIENAKALIENTINGFAIDYGLNTADSIYNKYFPYNRSGFELLVDEIAFHAKGEELTSKRKLELGKDVLKGIKSYLFSSPETFLFSDDIQGERTRLFVDSPTNLSLATILNKISQNPQTQQWFLQNGFLNKLSFDQNKNQTLSRVIFEAAAGENFDEKNIYLGFASLLEKETPLGTFNGITYTSRTLAQDLIAAAFLEGGIQGAKQYLKYIPVQYLQVLPFGTFLSAQSFRFTDTFGGIATEENGFDPRNPSKFTRQYFQNNPSQAKVIELSDIQGKPSSPPASFELTAKAMESNILSFPGPDGETITTQTKFLSIFHKKSPGKYAIYEFNEETRRYVQIPTLADDNGFTQYDIAKKIPQSIVAKTPVPTTTTASPAIEVSNIEVKEVLPLKIRTDLRGQELVNSVLNQIETDPLVSGYNKELINILRTLAPLADIKIIVNPASKGVGSYSASSNTITYNFDLMNELKMTADEKASAVLHELIHGYTSKLVKDFVNGKLENLSQEQIRILENLRTLQTKYINHIINSGKTEQYQLAMARYKAFLDKKAGKSNIPDVGVLTKEELSEFYGAMKLEEFITMALTDAGFQKHLNSVKAEKQSFWKELIKVLADLIGASFGFRVDPDSLLPHAVNESINLMKTYTSLASTKERVEDNFEIVPDADVNPEDFTSTDELFLPLTSEKIQEFRLLCKK